MSTAGRGTAWNYRERDSDSRPDEERGAATLASTRSAQPVDSLWRAADADDAVEQLYAAHYRQLVRLAVLLVRDQATAEEVVQDSFVAVHGRWRSLADPDKALAYLRQTVVNKARSVLRHRGVEARYVVPAERAAPGADGAVVEHERRAQVLDALRRLPDRQREVLALRYYLDLSEAAIADTLGISRGAVKSHASRGARALRSLLEDLR